MFLHEYNLEQLKQNRLEQMLESFCKRRSQGQDNLFDELYKPKRNEGRKHPKGLFWELFLDEELVKQDIEILVGARPNEGPDFGFEYKGKKIHIEAIAIRLGKHLKENFESVKSIAERFEENREPVESIATRLGKHLKENCESLESTVGELDDLHVKRLGYLHSKRNKFPPYFVDGDEVLLRLTHAFDKKYEQYKEYQAKNVVKEEDCKIIAINTADLGISGTFPCPKNLPYIYMALFGLGPQEIDINTNTYGYPRRLSIKNPGKGEPISSDFFVNNSYRDISAVIVSNISPDLFFFPDLFSVNESLFSEFDKQLLLGKLLVVKNPCARNPIPEGFFENSVNVCQSPISDELLGTLLLPSTPGIQAEFRCRNV
ncbi:MAG: hypothetical protein SFZ03_00050 [Candidatus Melainabacteria bacterium]|nr:hypothetical protein [Candidatus Melainabacteria bacterium]